MNYKKETLERHKNRVRTLLKNGWYNAACNYISKHRIPGYAISKSSVKKKYGLSEKQISDLHFFHIDNPHYKCAAPMKCYLIHEIESVYGRQGKLNKVISNINN